MEDSIRRDLAFVVDAGSEFNVHVRTGHDQADRFYAGGARQLDDPVIRTSQRGVREVAVEKAVGLGYRGLGIAVDPAVVVEGTSWENRVALRPAAGARRGKGIVFWTVR